MKFKVIIGTHVEGNKTYNKGDVVESDHNLVDLFKEKFVKVEAAEEAPKKDPVLATSVPSKTNPVAHSHPAKKKSARDDFDDE